MAPSQCSPKAIFFSSWPWMSCGDGSFAGAADGVGVLGEDAAFVPWLRCLPTCEALGDLFGGDLEAEFAVGDVEGDGVALADGGDGAAELGLGSDVAGHQAAGCATEAGVGQGRYSFRGLGDTF